MSGEYPMSLEFNAKGRTFTVASAFSEGHLPSDAEAEALNKFLASRLRELVIAGKITSRLAAEAWLNSDECLGVPETTEEVENLEDLL